MKPRSYDPRLPLPKLRTTAGAIACPFAAIAKKHPTDARLLAIAYVAAREEDDLFPIFRAFQMMDHGWLGGYLEGCYMVAPAPADRPTIAFLVLASYARLFLGHGIDSGTRLFLAMQYADAFDVPSPRRWLRELDAMGVRP